VVFLRLHALHRSADILLGRDGSYTHNGNDTYKNQPHSYRVGPPDLVSHYGSRKGRG
jgi:hypothetical protein